MPAIENHRIAGTRISVWDILHHLENNWSLQEIASLLGVSVDQVQAAADYIEEHRDEVTEVHRRIEERNARGNSPEVQAKLAQAEAKKLAWLAERRDHHSQERSSVGNRP